MKHHLFKTALFLAAFQFGFLVLGAPVHDFHVSIWQLDYNPDPGVFQITGKIFTEDLEKAIEIQGSPKLRLGSKKEEAKANEYIEHYLRLNLDFEVNGKPVTFDFLGKEVELDITWVYLSLDSIPNLKTLSIENTLLTEIIDDQVNLCHANVRGRKESLLLKKSNPSGVMEFGD